MKSAENIKVGISIGDLNGIGSEIVLKTFEDQRMLELCTPVIFASAKTISFLKKKYNSEISIQGVDNASEAIDGKFNVVNVWKENVSVNFGEEDPKIGEFAFRSLEAATKALKEGLVDVLVTAPINKHTIQSENFQFPGHTDYLAKEFNGESLMLMVTDTLKVGLLTDHVPVKDVAAAITPQLIEKKVNIIYKTLKQDFRIQEPKIAVLGINPHSGDGGVIGKEDEDIMKPTLEKMRNNGKMVFGPYSADSFFGSGNYKNFDAIIAAYHDQGLIPFKTLSFGSGVNFTAGLEKVRTSPDHGTAYEIAGKNEADHHSFKEAVFKAIDIFRNREEYKELTSNVLKKQSKKI
ncbi:4-hydroxythreonine-4-phosphate dehydrogenase PdxA [Salinimicrobium flavum]|uniref:4-hydroxythreonine-4-phosphate dehydrogenase PdxA n=1 Tax=Salinimicrobium flavum TaxID=1737065 RepID=A0ABW5IWK3_9FLAO